MPSLRDLLKPSKIRIKRLEELEKQYECTDPIYIRSLNERSKAEYEVRTTFDKTGRGNAKAILKTRPELILLCLCDEQGTPLRGRQDLDDIATSDGQFTTDLYLECLQHISGKSDQLVTVDSVKNSEGGEPNSPPCESPPETE